MINLRSATPGRIPAYEDTVQPAAHASRKPGELSPPAAHRNAFRTVRDVVSWMHRGYTNVNATDMAAAVAFQMLIALVPMLLLLVAVAGLFLQNDTVLHQARLAIYWIVPNDTADQAFTTALTVRQHPGWIGVISFLGLVWIGTGLVSCLARSTNRIYGARSAGYVNEKQRGFFVLIVFSFLFLVSSVATIVPTFFVNRDIPHIFERWLLASNLYQVAGYATGFVAAIALFFTIYRVIPNAGQRALDVWPGTLTAATLYVLVSQVFPIYMRLTGGGNRFGQTLGFVSLLVVSLLALAHIILFGAYLNATWQRYRRLKHRRRIEAQAMALVNSDDGDHSSSE